MVVRLGIWHINNQKENKMTNVEKAIVRAEVAYEKLQGAWQELKNKQAAHSLCVDKMQRELRMAQQGVRND